MRRPRPTGGGGRLVSPKQTNKQYLKEPITFFNSTTAEFATLRPPISCRFTTVSLPTLRMKIPPAKISPDILSPSQRPTFTPLFLYESTLTCGPVSSVGIATSYGLDGPRFESCAARDIGLSAESLELPWQIFSHDCLKGGVLVWPSPGTWVPRQSGNGKRKLCPCV